MGNDLKRKALDAARDVALKAVRGIMATDERSGRNDREIGVPISRRGLLAAGAILAGLGLLGTQDALALTSPSLSVGAGRIGPAAASGLLTHAYSKDRGVDDPWFGYVNDWTTWCLYGEKLYADQLAYAFAMIFECDWSNELYDHIIFRPFFICASYCSANPWRGYWLGSGNGDDNRGSCYIDGVELGHFQANFINNGTANEDRYLRDDGWLIHGFYETGNWSTFLRREPNQKGHVVSAKIEVYNCWKNGSEPSDTVVSTQDAPSGSYFAIQTEKIYIDNSPEILGGIFMIEPVQTPGLRVDMCQGYRDSDGDVVAGYKNQGAVVLWKDYKGVNQNWIMRPHEDDSVGGFTFCIANMLGPGLDRAMNNLNRLAPSMDRGTVGIWRESEASERSGAWWVSHEAKASHETDRKCWFITSDADGQRLDTLGVSSSSTDSLATSSYAKPGVWADSPRAQWNLIEAVCGGSMALSAKEVDLGDKISILGWHNEMEKGGISPSTYVKGIKNEASLPVYPMFRLYMTESKVEVDDDPDAVIMASCGIVARTSADAECQANFHIGWPHTGHSIYNLAMRLKGSVFSGSIRYAARPQGGGAWSEGADGERILASESNPVAQVKIWLEGDIAEEYDLCYRAFLGGLGWSDTVYSSSSDEGSAPVVGTLASEPDMDSGSTGWFEFRTPSGLCLDIEHGDTKGNVNGQNVQVCVSNSRVSQQFCVYARGGTTYISNYLGWLIDVYSNKNVQIWQANTGSGPKWQFEEVEGGVLVRSQWTGGLMTYASDSNLANVTCEAERDDHANQVWRMVPVPARSEGATGKILGLNVHLIRKPHGARVVHEFMTDEEFKVTEEMGSGYLYAAAMLGIRTVPFTESRVWTDRYRGTVISEPCRVESVCVEYYSDGVDGKHMVYRDSDVHAGDAYVPVAAALEAAGKKPCNLDAHFGDDAATGFTGWFKDTGLTDAAANLEVPEKGVLKLYGRNRCTLRIEYAQGSVEPAEGAVFRKKPSDSAEVVDSALGLIDFTGRAESHALDGIDLPAIGDDGAAHAAFYRGESVTLAGAADVYTKLGDGTWRRLVFKGYLSDKAGGGRLSRRSRWSATRPFTPCGLIRSRTASPQRRNSLDQGRGCGPRPGHALVPEKGCAACL